MQPCTHSRTHTHFVFTMVMAQRMRIKCSVLDTVILLCRRLSHRLTKVIRYYDAVQPEFGVSRNILNKFSIIAFLNKT